MMPSKREQLLEIMEDAAKGETTATLRARIAELEAEVERLTKDAESYRDIAARKSNQVAGMIRAEALSRTGAVKKAQASIEARIADNEAFQEKHRATWTPENAAYSRGIRDGLSGAAAILDIALSALEPAADHIADAGKMVEPAAPEGEQEPVITVYEPYPGAFDGILGPDTRPSEQAVTDAMVEAAAAELRKFGWTYNSEHVRAAIKAAMEAGR